MPDLPAAALDALMTMTTELLRTPLHDWHVAHGGRMVDFAGWTMPVQYTSIAGIHNATRNTVRVVDFCPIWRLHLPIPTAAVLLDSIVTGLVVDLNPKQIR